jgi:lipoyl(octanoyl) transferase
MIRDLWVIRLGTLRYQPAREAQARLAAARQAEEVPDLLLLLEHPPVYTRGRRSQPQELPMGEDWYRAQGIEVCDTDRGGAVTYHGPGQLVAYPIVSLNEYGNRAAPGREAEDVARMGVHEYVRRLERVMIETLARWGIEAQTIEGLTGVWTTGSPPANGHGPGDEARKIGSIGIHISRGVTTHGLAINVNNDTQPFEWIVPCGIEGARMTSVSRELGAEQDLAGLGEVLAQRFGAVYDRRLLPVEATELAQRVHGVEALAGPQAAQAEAALR